MNETIVPEVVKEKPKRKEVVTINKYDNRKLIVHIHKHRTYNSTRQTINNRKGTIPKKCLICSNLKRMKPNEQFCSMNCFNLYREYKIQKLRMQMNEVNSVQESSWWKIW